MKLEPFRQWFYWIVLQAFLGVPVLCAQVNVMPAADNCGCNGTATFTGGPASNTNYTLYNSSQSALANQTSANGSVNFTGLCAGLYLIQYTDAGATEHVAFNIPQQSFNPGTASTATVCSNQIVTEFANLISPLAAGGTWTTPSGAPHASSFNTNADTPGLFVYTLTNNGCTVTTGVYIEVIQNSDPGLFTNYLFCEIDPPFNMLDVLEGTPDAGGTWYNSSMQIVNGVFDPATMPTQTFTYVLAGVQGCPQVFNTLICTNTPLPNPGIDNTITSCSGGVPFNLTAQLLGSPQAGGTWYSPTGVAISNTFNPATQAAGTYRYQLPAINTCPPQQSLLTIDLLAANPSGESSSITLCPQSGPIDLFTVLGGSPLTGGTWRNPSNQVTDNIYDPATEATGNYTYAYPNVGCSPQASIVTVQLQATPSAGTDRTVNVCQSTTPYNLSNALSAGATAGGSWRTQAGAPVSGTVSANVAGTYIFIYSVGGGSCALDESTITLIVSAPNPPLNDNNLSFCTTDAPFDIATLYTNVPGLYFRIPSGAVVPSVFNPAAPTSTTYYAISPTGNVCPSSVGTINITLETPAFTSADPFVGLCSSGQPFDLTTISTSIDFTNGTWTNEAGSVVSPLISTTAASNAVYTFTSPAGTECAASVLNVSVQIDLPVEAGSDSNLNVCHTDAAFSLNSQLNGASSLAGVWSRAGSALSDTMFDPSNSPSGIYTYTLFGSGACPADQSNHVINVDNGFALDAGIDVEQCSGEGDIVLGTPAQPGVSYTWSPNTGLSASDAATATLSGDNGSATSFNQLYTLTATDGLCTQTDTVRVIVHPTPVLTLPATIERCLGQSVTLTVPSNFDVQWTPNGYFSNAGASTQVWQPVQSITVGAQIANEWGCSDQAYTNIIVHPLPQAQLSLSDTSACAFVEYVLTTNAIEDNVYQWWSNGALLGQGDSLAHTFDVPGVYDVELIVSNAFGCSDTASASGVVEVFPLPVADFLLDPGKITTLNNTVALQNQSEGAVRYQWDFSGFGRSEETSPTYTFLSKEAQEFTICLVAFSSESCTDTVCKELPMVDEYILYVPNSFTPDMDGLNDVFKPVLLGFEADTYTLQIFDRWGIKVFESHNPEDGWLGDVMGSSYFANNDVYTWQIEVKRKAMADYQTFRGTVTLLR